MGFWLVLFLIILALIVVVVIIANARPDFDCKASLDDFPAPDGKPHEFRLEGKNAREFPEPPEELSRRLDALALAQPRVKRLCGDVKSGRMIYEARSPFFRFPDYVYAHIDAAPKHQSRISILSRSRFGVSDFGVNKKRVESWLNALASRANAAKN